MEFKNKSTDQKVEELDYLIQGAVGGTGILSKISKIRLTEEEEVIYGVYDNRDKGWMVRFNDFLIDRSRVSLKDKSYFFHMLAVMVDAGIPVLTAVKSLARKGTNPRFRRILNTVSYQVERGQKLSEALGRFDDVFDESEIGIVKSGEATGRLDKMLFKLSTQLDKKHDLSLKLYSAAFYPVIVLSVLIIVSVGMLIWVFPTLLGLLQESGISQDKLPLATRGLIAIQNAFVNFWWLILIVIFVIYGIFKFYTQTDYGSVKWDYAKLRFPIIGGLLRKINVLRFVDNLGLLIESGLPVIRTLNITGNSLTNKVYKIKTQEVLNKVKEGEKISASLKDSEFLFPPEVVQMLNVGEKSASLGKVSEKIANQYQREIDNSLKKITAVFEPVMILIVGLFVGLLALAIMAPIFNIGSNVAF